MRIISGVIVRYRREPAGESRSLGDGQDYARNDYEDDHPKKTEKKTNAKMSKTRRVLITNEQTWIQVSVENRSYHNLQ